MKIYTKKGDQGNTQLFGGTQVPKGHIRVNAYGTIDELNSHIGLLLAEPIEQNHTLFLSHVQVLLFDIGSHIATDPSKEQSKQYLPPINQEELVSIENTIDELQSHLEPLTNFILPAGSRAIAQAHVCRTVCRRAERLVACLPDQELHSLLLPILNRLSDYFFVLARIIAKNQQIKEIKWQPRKQS